MEVYMQDQPQPFWGLQLCDTMNESHMAAQSVKLLALLTQTSLLILDLWCLQNRLPIS